MQSLRATLDKKCISTKAGTFTNLPHCGKVVPQKWDVAVVSGKLGRAVPALVVKGGLFDGTNCGLRLSGKPVFSVQHHPEASPGPQDSHYLFRRFINMVRENKGEAALAER